jgi:DNA integrity scanning protein DisA with diadenylate cyclase activity
VLLIKIIKLAELYFKINMQSRVKIISQGQVRKIFEKVSKRYTIVNMGTYFVITDNEINETTSYTYDTNYVFLNFCKSVRIEYILMVNESHHYFSWRRIGFELAGEREKYLNRIIYKVIELACGWKCKQ